MRKKLAVICLFLLLCGCGRQEQTSPTVLAAAASTVAPTEAPVTMPPTVESEAAALVEAPPPAVSVVLEAVPSGEQEERCADAVID